MTLPRGITGFWDRRGQPPPTTDLRAFRRHCYEAARHLGGRVHSLEEPNGRNFALAILVIPSERVTVLLNAHFPVIAFVDPPGEGEVLFRFRDCDPLAECLRGFGIYEIRSMADLERRPSANDFRELSEAERMQVAYWRPKRIGDVIFNWWD